PTLLHILKKLYCLFFNSSISSDCNLVAFKNLILSLTAFLMCERILLCSAFERNCSLSSLLKFSASPETGSKLSFILITTISLFQVLKSWSLFCFQVLQDVMQALYFFCLM